MERRTVNTTLSADVVQYLLDRGMTLAEIAATLKVTKSFVSRVRSRQRSLTVDHLITLERLLGRPLPLLLIEATPKEEIPLHLLPLYEATKAVLESALPPRTRRSGVRTPKASASASRRKAG